MLNRLFLLVAVLFAGCSNTSSEPPKPAATATSEVAVKVLPFADLQALIASHKDKRVVVVDFWATY